MYIGRAAGSRPLPIPAPGLLAAYCVVGTLAAFVALAGLVPQIPLHTVENVSPLLLHFGISIVAGWGSVALLNYALKLWLPGDGR